MAGTFHLQIVTPEGLKFDEQVENIILRTTEGDVGIMKNHIGYVCAIDAGKVKVKFNGTSKFGAASEGFIRVGSEVTTLVATAFEWSDEINIDRAKASLEKAKLTLNDKSADNEDIDIAKLRQKRANARIAAAEKK